MNGTNIEMQKVLLELVTWWTVEIFQISKNKWYYSDTICMMWWEIGVLIMFV